MNYSGTDLLGSLFNAFYNTKCVGSWTYDDRFSKSEIPIEWRPMADSNGVAVPCPNVDGFVGDFNTSSTIFSNDNIHEENDISNSSSWMPDWKSWKNFWTSSSKYDPLGSSYVPSAPLICAKSSFLNPFAKKQLFQCVQTKDHSDPDSELIAARAVQSLAPDYDLLYEKKKSWFSRSIGGTHGLPQFLGSTGSMSLFTYIPYMIFKLAMFQISTFLAFIAFINPFNLPEVCGQAVSLGWGLLYFMPGLTFQRHVRALLARNRTIADWEKTIYSMSTFVFFTFAYLFPANRYRMFIMGVMASKLKLMEVYCFDFLPYLNRKVVRPALEDFLVPCAVNGFNFVDYWILENLIAGRREKRVEKEEEIDVLNENLLRKVDKKRWQFRLWRKANDLERERSGPLENTRNASHANNPSGSNPFAAMAGGNNPLGALNSLTSIMSMLDGGGSTEQGGGLGGIGGLMSLFGGGDGNTSRERRRGKSGTKKSVSRVRRRRIRRGAESESSSDD